MNTTWLISRGKSTTPEDNHGFKRETGRRYQISFEFNGYSVYTNSYQASCFSDVDLDKLVAFHKNHGKMVTMTAVHPGARFGELEMRQEQVTSFQEKPQTKQGWINGGYLVIEPEFFDLIEEDQTILEREPLEKVTQMGELMAFRHNGFWQCMDTKRDRDNLEEFWGSGKAPWKR